VSSYTIFPPTKEIPPEWEIAPVSRWNYGWLWLCYMPNCDRNLAYVSQIDSYL